LSHAAVGSVILGMDDNRRGRWHSLEVGNRYTVGQRGPLRVEPILDGPVKVQIVRIEDDRRFEAGIEVSFHGLSERVIGSAGNTGTRLHVGAI
jgi:hypothetical protein